MFSFFNWIIWKFDGGNSIFNIVHEYINILMLVFDIIENNITLFESSFSAYLFSKSEYLHEIDKADIEKH